MLTRFICIAFAASLLATTTPAFAQDAPDLTGTWSGPVTGGVRFGGDGNIAPPDNSPAFVHPERRPEYTLVIAKQEGRGLIGTWGSINGSEAIQGVVRLDNTELLLVDGDSYFQGRLLSETEMELCNQTIEANKLFALCVLLKKQ